MSIMKNVSEMVFRFALIGLLTSALATVWAYKAQESGDADHQQTVAELRTSLRMLQSELKRVQDDKALLVKELCNDDPANGMDFEYALPAGCEACEATTGELLVFKGEQYCPMYRRDNRQCLLVDGIEVVLQLANK